MTKYILNSGGLNKYPEKIDKFHKEIVQGLGINPGVLCCYFAISENMWSEKFLKHSSRFLKSMENGIVPKFELANFDNFENQIKNNDIIFLYGGDSVLLLQYLKKFNLPLTWKDKVVVGSSAGSDVLAKYSWNLDERLILEGLDVVPIKFIPHYKSDYGNDDFRGPIEWDRAYKELLDYKESVSLHALEEGDYIVVEV